MRVFIFALLTFALVAPAYAQVHVDIGIRLPSLPRLVVVPEVRSVQYVPSGHSKLFFHDGRYWAFANGGWHASRGYNGPWTVVGRNVVPQSVLLVPVNYYRARPGHWNQWQRQHPPRWGNEWGHEWAASGSGGIGMMITTGAAARITIGATTGVMTETGGPGRGR